MNRLRSLVKSVLKSVLPLRIQRLLRARHRDFVFRRAMKRFLKHPEACIHPGNSVINDLIYGWGNEDWSARDEYLVCCLEHAQTADAPLLECGSGLSTILVGAVAKQRGYRHWAFEHTPGWADKVQRYLNKYKIDSVVLCAKPLKNFGGYFWYDPPLEKMPDDFALVICDGPPGDTKGGRYGLVPVMKERLKQGCIILLDDAGRKEEQAIAKRWEAELGSPFEVLGHIKPYIKMTVAGRSHQNPA